MTYCTQHANSRERLTNPRHLGYVGPECPDCMADRQIAGAHARANLAEERLQRVLDYVIGRLAERWDPSCDWTCQDVIAIVDGKTPDHPPKEPQ